MLGMPGYLGLLFLAVTTMIKNARISTVTHDVVGVEYEAYNKLRGERVRAYRIQRLCLWEEGRQIETYYKGKI